MFPCQDQLLFLTFSIFTFCFPNSKERQRYLQRALKTHEKIEFSGIDVSEYKAMGRNRKSRFD